MVGLAVWKGLLQRCVQSLALIHNRTFVTPDDVKTAAPAVMAHRLLTRDRRMETGRAVIEEVLESVRVPVD